MCVVHCTCTSLHVLLFYLFMHVYTGCMTCRGCTPLDVATATIRDNTELCLALDDVHLRHVVSLLVTTTTSVTGGGGSMEQGSGGGGGGDDGREGSVMCEWAPNGGEKCLEFLQCAVWADGMYICTLYTYSHAFTISCDEDMVMHPGS